MGALPTDLLALWVIHVCFNSGSVKKTVFGEFVRCFGGLGVVAHHWSKDTVVEAVVGG